MPLFTLVTGNKHKLAQFERLLVGIDFDHVDLDLPEIQSADPKEILEAKARAAYAIIKKPVVVEDVSAGLDELAGLPGPFIKFFEQKLGKDAIYQLKGGGRVTVDCLITYYDGTRFIHASGTVTGEAVPARGENGFGFDCCFMPDGFSKTYAEMPPEEKDAMSHRTLAINALLPQLKHL